MICENRKVLTGYNLSLTRDRDRDAKENRTEERDWLYQGTAFD